MILLSPGLSEKEMLRYQQSGKIAYFLQGEAESKREKFIRALILS